MDLAVHAGYYCTLVLLFVNYGIIAMKQSTDGPRVLVTGGPTIEDIDAVRYITNRSTGRMGICMAQAAARAGAHPVLVLGPTHLDPGPDIETIRVRSAAQMTTAVMERLEHVDALVMTAAVADYTPIAPAETKIKKQDGDLVLRLRRTQDILAAVAVHPARERLFVVGFSLDVALDLAEGQRKLQAKHLDCIVVNTVASFGAPGEQAVLLQANGTQELGAISKDALGDRIMELITTHTKGRQA